MTETTIPEAAPSGESTAGLSQGARVIDTFVAPSKTFTDILRNKSWWLPFLLGVIVSYGYVFALQKQVGWDVIAANSLKQDPKAAEKLASAPAEQQAQTQKIVTASIQYAMYASPIIILVSAAVIALVWWGTINFVFGGRATFGGVFSMWMYASLPLLFLSVLAIVSLFAGLDREAFNINNPVGTNLGFYLPAETAPWLMKVASAIDLFWLWSLFLAGTGLAIVAKVKKSSGLIAVFGWWVLIQVVKVVYTAITG